MNTSGVSSALNTDEEDDFDRMRNDVLGTLQQITTGPRRVPPPVDVMKETADEPVPEAHVEETLANLAANARFSAQVGVIGLHLQSGIYAATSVGLAQKRGFEVVTFCRDRADVGRAMDRVTRLVYDLGASTKLATLSSVALASESDRLIGVLVESDEGDYDWATRLAESLLLTVPALVEIVPAGATARLPDLGDVLDARCATLFELTRTSLDVISNALGSLRAKLKDAPVVE